MCNCGSLAQDHVQLRESGARLCAIVQAYVGYDFSVVCVISIVPGCRGVGRWGRVQEESNGGGSNEGTAGVTGMKTTIVVSHHQRDALGVVWFPTFVAFIASREGCGKSLELRQATCACTHSYTVYMHVHTSSFSFYHIAKNIVWVFKFGSLAPNQA